MASDFDSQERGGGSMKKLAIALAAVSAVGVGFAATPVVVWDGAASAYNFSNLTRTVGDNTYTLTVNENASVAADGSYITIGTENQKKTVTITANSEASAPFGSTSASGFSAIIRASNTATSLDSNRAIVNFYTASQEAGASIGHKQNGYAFPFVNGEAYPAYATSEPVFTSGDDIQTIALTYGTNPQGGTAIYVDGVQVYQAATMTSSYFTTPTGVSVGGMGKDGSGKMYALQGMKIYSIAVFTNRLTAAEVAAYAFPSVFNGETTVSAINARFGTASEIDVYLAGGTTITGDTTFNASTVHFHCDGSFTMTAPEGSTATFDFSDVTGGPVLKYTGFFPTVSGTTFTSNSIPTSVSDASSWKGTVWVRGAAMTDLNPDTYGNGSSTLRLSGCQGHFASGVVNCNIAIELENDAYQYGININNGYSRNSSTSNNRVVINKLKGAGAVWTSTGAPTVLINVRDWSDFTGPLQFFNKILVLGEEIPAIDDFNVAGSIYICAGATLTATSQLRADGGIYVNGELSAPNVGTTYIKDGTIIHVPDMGVLTLTNSGNINDTTANYGCIQGAGTLKLVSQGNYYRCISTVNFPTNMIVQTELEGGFLLRNSGAEYTIGSFAGSGYVRSDWNEGDRNLRILQAKDTTYSGVFDANIDRVGTVTVAPGVSTAGTLTLSGVQTANNNLVIESGAAVNLTGTWVGATTVAGTFGGTGTLTGSLTLSDGAMLAVDTLSDLLTVTGDITASGTVTIRLPAGTSLGNGVEIASVGGDVSLSSAMFNVCVGAKLSKAYVRARNGKLRISLLPLAIKIR